MSSTSCAHSPDYTPTYVDRHVFTCFLCTGCPEGPRGLGRVRPLGVNSRFTDVGVETVPTVSPESMTLMDRPSFTESTPWVVSTPGGLVVGRGPCECRHKQVSVPVRVRWWRVITCVSEGPLTFFTQLYCNTDS